MAKATKTATKKAKPAATLKKSRAVSDTEPKFPYTTKPASLRRLLKEIPQKPKPPKFDMTLLKSWGFNDQNDHSMLRVLKSVNLLDSKNEPTELYIQFMNLEGGARVLGPEVKRVYAPLFQASHTPYNESNDRLQNLFNIHSGGGNRALDQQIQTFKALCENAIFDGTANDPLSAGSPATSPDPLLQRPRGRLQGASGSCSREPVRRSPLPRRIVEAGAFPSCSRAHRRRGAWRWRGIRALRPPRHSSLGKGQLVLRSQDDGQTGRGRSILGVHHRVPCTGSMGGGVADDAFKPMRSRKVA